MPWPNPYNGGQDDDQTRAVDLVHIEPSIREGLHLVPSLYGPDASRPLRRYPPINLTPPFLTGSGVIPNRIICQVGVWDSSPTPDFQFQFMLDGVDIPSPDLSVNFIDTDASFDGGRLTCEVVANNGIGQDNALTSNFIDCSLIEPVEIDEMEFFALTGMRANKHLTAFDDRTMMLTGMGTDNRQDVMRAVAMYLTGMGAENRQDINAMPLHVITGLGNQDETIVHNHDGIAVISKEEGRPLVDGVQQLLPIKNANAEMGVEGWDNLGGVFFGDEFVDGLNPIEGDFGFKGGENVDPANANTPFTFIWQDVPLWDTWHADIDAGTCHLDMYYLVGLRSGQGNDRMNVRVEFYAQDGTTQTGLDGGNGMYRPPTNFWFPMEFTTPIPPLTRFVRVYVEFLWDDTADNDLDTMVDEIRPYIRKGDLLTDRSGGPDFQMWRVKLTQATTWSGGAMSEVEFRGTPLGTDLATGGSVLFGSAGLGTVNADALFDDALNTNYWAGAENSISNGTSWVGYDMGVQVRPEELALTARLGSDALQMPRAWEVQGSDDGINWRRVEIYDSERVGAEFNSGETRVFPISTGVIPRVLASVPAPPNGLAVPSFTTGNWNARVKAMAYISLAHIDIERIYLLTLDQVFNYEVQLVKLSPVYSAAWSFGTVTEVLYEDLNVVNAPASGSASASTWQEIILPSPVPINAGEYFGINFRDPDAVNNSFDANEGRLASISSWNGGGDFAARHGGAIRKIRGMHSNQSALPGVGGWIASNFNSETGGDFPIDIQGSYF
ncbi:structural protein [Roseobacter phage RD-1410Ws-07]|uniref:Structural protein n=1 Tax=Roseobacter phage RD-1410Ws-07 TaxID=1815985 RepID=A0A191VYU9_9CAUD|nr:structural protein [Roseobacter phage RD-1410Ws-07]